MQEQLSLDVEAVPYGYCHCRCGGKTPLSKTWRRGYKRGDPLKYIHGHNGRKEPTWTVEDRGYKTPCWIWGLATDGVEGYGHLELDGRHVGAHRWVYERYVGPIPDGLQLDHLCRVKPCVNPAHLEPVTHSENLRRRPCTRITFAQAQEIKRRLRAGEVQARIAEDYGLSQRFISDVKRERAWRDA